MAVVSGVAISGVYSALPAVEKDNEACEVLNDSERLRLIESTGIHQRRVVVPGQTALDLSKEIGGDFIQRLGWELNDIGLVLFVTQTPDYPYPGNAVQLQHYLGLNKSTVAFDINLGCSGFVYGLWASSQLLLGLPTKKALLVVGDTTSTQYSSDNRAVNTLFGDAVSLIALEKNSQADAMVFDLGSDGAGTPYLIQPNRGAKNPDKALELFMDGTQVFVFTLREIPNSILSCLNQKQWLVADVDFCVMHQANEMMLKRLGNKIGFLERQMVIAMKKVGNTSSASIPLSMTLSMANSLCTQRNKLILSGFGVGWSWATVAFEQSPMKVCALRDFGQ